MASLDKKTALVTGASRGLGRAIAELLAAEGAAVAIVDLKQHWSQAVVDEIRANGGTAIALEADVSSREAVRAAIEATYSEFGSLDVLVNNAMWNRYEPISEIRPETLDKMLGVGVCGIIWAIQAAAEKMAVRGGSIINIASVSAVLGIPSAMAYCAVKAAVGGITRSGSVELGKHGIRVNSIAPSTVATEGVKAMLSEQAFSDRIERTPLGRLGTVADIAQAALWLASDGSTFVTGQTITVDGGISHAI